MNKKWTRNVSIFKSPAIEICCDWNGIKSGELKKNKDD